jgi:carotenoid cleavage dioxygenase-like enzyme
MNRELRAPTYFLRTIETLRRRGFMSLAVLHCFVPSGHQLGFQTQREEVEPTELSVEGSLPGWLTGRLLRNGPGQFEAGDTDLRHWFDPYAMLRGFRIDGQANAVTYTNRFVRSDDFEYAREEGGVRRMLPGTPPDQPVWTRVRDALSGNFQDNPSIGVVDLAGTLHAVTESPVGIGFEESSLETTDRRDLTTGLDADFTLGHPHYDPERDVLVNFGVEYDRETTYTLFERDTRTAETTEIGRVTFEDAPYAHSFAMTEEFVVLAAIPFGLDTTSLLRGAFTDGTFVSAVTEFETAGMTRDARFIVMDRESGEIVREVPADPFFVYHHANAYRDGETLVIDLIAYEDERAMTNLTIQNLADSDPDVPTGDLVRYTVPLNSGRATRETLYEGQVEFPTLNYPNYLGRKHRYVYLAANDDGSSLPTRLVKYDTEERTATEWEPAGTTFPGEPLFEAAPGAEAEDAGAIVTTVLDAEEEVTRLVVLDARTMEEVARADCPHWVPYGFHGQFYRDTKPVRSMA